MVHLDQQNKLKQPVILEKKRFHNTMRSLSFLMEKIKACNKSFL